MHQKRVLPITLVLLGLGLACHPGADLTLEQSGLANDPSRLRVVAANLSSGSGQDYDLGHGARILQGLGPDVVLIQEFNYGNNSATDLRTFVDQTFGTEFAYFREGGSENIPNGVISRYPIIDAGEWADSQVPDRDFAWARIDIPGSTHLFAISVHLKSASASTQNAEANALVNLIRSNVPAGDYIVIGGDLNTTGRTSSAVRTLAQVVSTSGPYPADQSGNGNTNANRSRPYDWVLPSSALAARRIPVVTGSRTHTNGLVVDTRVYNPLSDLSPARSTDSSASGMQHMAVVMDFDLGQVAAPDAGFPDTGVVVDAGFPDAGFPDAGFPDSGVVVDAGFPPVADAVFINEILANEPGSDSAGEFVEVVNGSASSVDISGWQISDAASVRHTFAANTVLAAGEAIVVFGGASAIPGDLGNAVAASSGALGLSNGGDTVTLADGAGTVDGFSYTSALSGTDGVSMNRDPDADPSGAFVLHTSLGASSSPGRRADGSAFGGGGGTPTPPLVFINEVLANEPGSVVAGEFVELVNLGGAVDLGGYRLQDGAAVRHVFASGTILGTNQGIVVYGGASAIPGGFTAVAASTGGLGLSNSGDTVTLDDGSAVVDSVSYTSALAGADGVSMNRNPDVTPGASMSLHTALGGNSSPGTRASGGGF